MANKEDDDFNQKLWNLMLYGFWGNDKELDEALPFFGIVAGILVAGILLYLIFK